MNSELGELESSNLVPIRQQIHYQSGLSSTTSLAAQQEYHIYFHPISALEDDELSTDAEVQSCKKCEVIKMPLEDMLDDATVQDAIHQSIYHINNALAISKAGIRIADDDRLFDLYLAKKNGKKKSFPPLYPLEKISKFSKSNLTLVTTSPSSIVRPNRSLLLQKQQSSHPLLRKAESKQQPVPEIQSGNSAIETIKELPEKEKIEEQGGKVSKQSFDNKAFSSVAQTGVPPQHEPSSQRRSVLSTITPKQTKIEEQAYDDDEFSNMKSSSSCFLFSCCIKKSNQSSSQKKMQAPLLSS